ncbi:MAG: SpoIIE family protein phosphatase [Lachnospiraceae bacterium]|jgi:stage II sporulation protein E|nr:SpoIIE family protein phosphatase [Lachnospiraceae bacterium]MCI8994956.1 SpoIIE family protein phosphatase [Lachnospiraceae bacterium]MCI9133442.1 SpoIIE family protein phosphatase [Lachnospiraceae bacterium]
MRQDEEQKGTGYRWIYGITAGICVAAMQIGVGLLQVQGQFVILMGLAQGTLVCSLTILCGGMLEWLFAPLRAADEEEGDLILHPARERIREYELAFQTLAGSFSIPKGGMVRQQAALDMGDKIELLWNTRMEENREAVSQQLLEMAHIMGDTAEHVWELRTDERMEDVLRGRLRSMGLQVHAVLVYEEENRKKEVYLTLSTRRRKCVAVKDVASAISQILDKPMMPARDSRSFVSGERSTVLFLERTNFEVMYGVKKAVKGKEQISGDNFSVYTRKEGQLLASLSDGMGSGIKAYRESERVIDLLEQFLEAGFTKETAVRMINSALLIHSDAQTFSTIDMCSINLYSGVCEFLKVGASTTFIRREHQVDTISSTSLPAGVFHQLDLENVSRKLYDGDMVIMVTDGVLDALPAGQQEELMKQLILEYDSDSPQEVAEHILSCALEYEQRNPSDDMTVLALGLWKR